MGARVMTRSAVRLALVVPICVALARGSAEVRVGGGGRGGGGFGGGGFGARGGGGFGGGGGRAFSMPHAAPRISVPQFAPRVSAPHFAPRISAPRMAVPHY